LASCADPAPKAFRQVTQFGLRKSLIEQTGPAEHQARIIKPRASPGDPPRQAIAAGISI